MKPCATRKSRIGGKERDRDEGEHQPGAQMRAEDAPAALEDQLHEVARHQEDQQDEQDEVQVDEQEEDDVVAERVAARELRQAGLEEGEEQHRERGDEDDQPFAPPLALAAGDAVGRARRLDGRASRSHPGSGCVIGVIAAGAGSAPEEVRAAARAPAHEERGGEREVEGQAAAIGT